MWHSGTVGSCSDAARTGIEPLAASDATLSSMHMSPSKLRTRRRSAAARRSAASPACVTAIWLPLDSPGRQQMRLGERAALAIARNAATTASRGGSNSRILCVASARAIIAHTACSAPALFTGHASSTRMMAMRLKAAVHPRVNICSSGEKLPLSQL